MKNNSFQECESLLIQVFGELPRISFQNSLEIEYQNLCIGFWLDRGLYSVTIADETNTYGSSSIASFFDLKLHDAKDSPMMLKENLIFVRDRASEISNLLGEDDFVHRYEKETGYKPIQTETRA